MAQGRKIPDHVRASMVRDLRTFVHVDEVAQRYAVSVNIVHKIRAAERIYGRAKKRPSEPRHIKIDNALMPMIALMDTLPLAKKRGLQLQLQRVGNDARRIVA